MGSTESELGVPQALERAFDAEAELVTEQDLKFLGSIGPPVREVQVGDLAVPGIPWQWAGHDFDAVNTKLTGANESDVVLLPPPTTLPFPLGRPVLRPAKRQARQIVLDWVKRLRGQWRLEVGIEPILRGGNPPVENLVIVDRFVPSPGTMGLRTTAKRS